jgi:hypothetical protein
MSIQIHFRLARPGQEIEPVAQRRNLVFEPRRRFMIQQGGKAGKRDGRSYVLGRLGASDPAFEVNGIGHQTSPQSLRFEWAAMIVFLRSLSRQLFVPCSPNREFAQSQNAAALIVRIHE